MNRANVELSQEVSQALEEGQAIVALESTIITHGMPFPTNLEMAREVEEIVRNHGAVPATIAIIHGRVHFGLGSGELDLLTDTEGVGKATERDIPFVLAREQTAGTTVGASLAIATALGVRVFVTGGIGGVARDAATSLDISADLQALSRFQSIVICSGTKAFMDIGATLEYLETHSVGVVGYRSSEFPLFYSPSSGFSLDWTAREPVEIVSIFREQVGLGQTGALLVGVPVPEHAGLPYEATIAAIDEALLTAKNRGIRGKDLTPFVLEEIKDRSSGRSLEANLALIRNNARVGAEISVCLAKEL